MTSAREKIEKAGGTVTLREERARAAQRKSQETTAAETAKPAAKNARRKKDRRRRRKRRPRQKEIRQKSASVRGDESSGWFRRFSNSVKIPELRRRILFTLAVIVIVRLGAAITTPGVNQAVLQEWFRTALTEKSGGSVAALFNLFSGGALENCAIFSLGIMPYISASIMMQLLTAVIPQLGRLAREDGGRQKIMQYTRYATVVLCIFQGYLLAVSFQHPESYHTMLPGITDTMAKLGIPLVDDPGMVVSHRLRCFR